jgi:hypothetical protein
MNTMRVLKIGLAWITIAWTVCYLAFGLIPGLRSTFVPYITHINVGPVETIFTLGNFIVGLILWNAIVAAGVGLAGFLNNYIKD